MKPNPKTLQIFLPEGTPTGIQIAELTTRIVQVISVPRTHLTSFFQRPESDYVATYFLFGEKDEASKPSSYIGQTEDLSQRLRKHDKEKEFWMRALILVSKTQSFTQAHIRWLEWKSIGKAQKANRYNLENAHNSSAPFVTEAIQAEVEEIFETGSLLLQNLGYPIFEPLIPKEMQNKETNWFLSKRGAKATATFTDEGMIIHKQSICSKDFTPSAKNSHFERKREKLKDEGILESTSKGLVFTEDCKFNTPSNAAAVISGRHINGWTAWKNNAGKTLTELKRKNS